MAPTCVVEPHSVRVGPGHFAGEEVKAKLVELHGRWDGLKSKAAQRRQDLEDSLQAQQYFADANEAESWMREKEPIVGSPDYGKDEDSAEVHLSNALRSFTQLNDQLPLNWWTKTVHYTTLFGPIY